MCVIISWEHRFKLSLMTDMLQCGNCYILIVTELEEVINYCIPKCISDIKEESETNSAAGFDSCLSFCWVEVSVLLITHSRCFPDSQRVKERSVKESGKRTKDNTRLFCFWTCSTTALHNHDIPNTHPIYRIFNMELLFSGHFSSHWSNTISRCICESVSGVCNLGWWTGKSDNPFLYGEHSSKMQKSKKKTLSSFPEGLMLELIYHAQLYYSSDIDWTFSKLRPF